MVADPEGGQYQGGVICPRPMIFTITGHHRYDGRSAAGPRRNHTGNFRR